MMTLLEAKAQVIFDVLEQGASEWKTVQSEAASKMLQEFLAEKEIDAATFAQATIEVCGNVSAMRQNLEKFGLLKNSAAKPALISEIEKLQKARADGIAKLP